MHETIIIALIGITLLQFGYVFQKLGVHTFGNIKNLTESILLIKNKYFQRWLLGTLLTTLGTIIFFIALAFGSLSVLQPLQGIGPAILIVINYLFVKNVILHKVELFGILLSCIGIIIISFHTSSTESILFNESYLIFNSTFILIVCSIIGFLLEKLNKFDLGLFEGFMAGIFAGFSSIFAKIGLSFLLKFQFHWTIVFLLISQIVAFVLLQKGLHFGKVEKVVTLFTTFGIIIPVLFGIFIFGEILDVYIILGVATILLSAYLLAKNYGQLLVT